MDLRCNLGSSTRHSPRVPTLYPDRRTAHPTLVRSPRARYLRNTTRSSNKTIWTPPPREAVRFFLPISFLRRLGTNRWVTCSLPVMVQLNARTARPAGILEAQLTQHIALFEKMCGPVKHVRLAVRRRKKGGQRKRVVVDVASWEAEFDKYWALEWGELLV